MTENNTKSQQLAKLKAKGKFASFSDKLDPLFKKSY